MAEARGLPSPACLDGAVFVLAGARMSSPLPGGVMSWEKRRGAAPGGCPHGVGLGATNMAREPSALVESTEPVPTPGKMGPRLPRSREDVAPRVGMPPAGLVWPTRRRRQERNGSAASSPTAGHGLVAPAPSAGLCRAGRCRGCWLVQQEEEKLGGAARGRPSWAFPGTGGSKSMKGSGSPPSRSMLSPAWELSTFRERVMETLRADR